MDPGMTSWDKESLPQTGYSPDPEVVTDWDDGEVGIVNLFENPSAENDQWWSLNLRAFYSEDQANTGVRSIQMHAIKGGPSPTAAEITSGPMLLTAGAEYPFNLYVFEGPVTPGFSMKLNIASGPTIDGPFSVIETLTFPTIGAFGWRRERLTDFVPAYTGVHYFWFQAFVHSLSQIGFGDLFLDDLSFLGLVEPGPGFEPEADAPDAGWEAERCN